MDRDTLVPRIVSWAVYAVIAAGCFTARWFASGAAGTLFGAYDSLFVSGIIVVLCGALTLIAYFGAFDMFAYGFTSLFGHMGIERLKNRYKDYPDYLEAKRQHRASNKPYFLPYTVIAGTLLLAALILFFIYRAQ